MQHLFPATPHLNKLKKLAEVVSFITKHSTEILMLISAFIGYQTAIINKETTDKSKLDLALSRTNSNIQSQNSTEPTSETTAINFAQAQYLLGLAYRDGNGIPLDNYLAIKSLETAANAGHSNAQLELGIIYKYGNGTTKNHDKAKQYLLLAANQDNTNAQEELINLYYVGNARDKPDYQSSLKWLIKISKMKQPPILPQTDSDALYQIGLIYLQKDNPARDDSKAFDALLKSANLNNPDSQYIVGRLYFNGIGTQRNFETSKEWVLKAARQNQPEARDFFARHYLTKKQNSPIFIFR
jgi:TPR repeat protein